MPVPLILPRCLRFVLMLLFVMFAPFAKAQTALDSILPVRGLAIAAPTPRNVDSFVHFMEQELAPRHVNTLILRIDFRYQFTSYPQLTDDNALSKGDVKKLVAAAKKARIRIIPQVNLLGHQSWASETGKLLQVYPQFDETPWVQMPKDYKWPNEDGLYCKSYCPLHPDVHKVVFAVIDEICDAFETDAFHAGMDEVFYIGEEKCPRCGGRDKAELFTGEVNKIQAHLKTKNRELWIWGDRLIDGKTTGIGMWEGSYNNTHRAVDLISKDVVICDWHYERPDKTAVYFAMKGFRVITCPWRKPDVAVQQLRDMVAFRQQATKQMQGRFLGVMETVWSPVTPFLNGYYGKGTPAANEDALQTPWATFKTLYAEIGKLQKVKAK